VHTQVVQKQQHLYLHDCDQGLQEFDEF